MGVQLLWERPEADSNWEYADIYRADSQYGTYSKIARNSISDITYYDEYGTSSSWYKIKFVDSSGTESDFSDPFNSEYTNLYCNPQDAIIQAGLDPDDLPDPLTLSIVYQLVYDASRKIDNFRKTVYGRTESITNKTYSSKYMDMRAHLDLGYRNISDDDDFKVELLSGQSNWVERSQYYDYDVDFTKGRIHFYTLFVNAMRTYNDIRVSFNYGLSTIPAEVKIATKLLGAIGILVYLTNGSFDNVSTFSLGSANWSIGQAYVNLKEAWDMTKKELFELYKSYGWGDGTKKRFRIA